MDKKIATLLSNANNQYCEFKSTCDALMKEAHKHLTFYDYSAYCGTDMDGTISFFFEIPVYDEEGNEIDFDEGHFVSRNIVVSVRTFFDNLPKNRKYTPNQLAEINEA